MATIEWSEIRDPDGGSFVSGAFIKTCVIVIFVRRWTAANRARSCLWYRFISRGVCLHSRSFLFQKRRIPLSSIRRISSIDLCEEEKAGARYFVIIEQKDSTTTMFSCKAPMRAFRRSCPAAAVSGLRLSK